MQVSAGSLAVAWSTFSLVPSGSCMCPSPNLALSGRNRDKISR